MTINDITESAGNWKITRQRIIDLAIGTVILLLHEFIAKPYYRPFIFSNNIFDFHIADTLGNSLGTFAAVFIVAGLVGKDKSKNNPLIKTTILALVVYELLQPLLGKPIDPWDIAATLLTGGFCILLYKTIHNQKEKTTE